VTARIATETSVRIGSISKEIKLSPFLYTTAAEIKAMTVPVKKNKIINLLFVNRSFDLFITSVVAKDRVHCWPPL